MFIFTRFVALTSVFCVGVALLTDVGLILLARMNGGVGVAFSRWGWLRLWGIVWIGSFFLAWHLLVSPILSRAPKP